MRLVAAAITTAAFVVWQSPSISFFVLRSRGSGCLSPLPLYSLAAGASGRVFMSTLPVGGPPEHPHRQKPEQPTVSESSAPPIVPLNEKNAMKKQRKKVAKEAKREKRQGNDLKLKPCDLCLKDKDLLIRCQIDTTLAWKMVCGKCWKDVSGGVVDGDAAHPHYRYGGLWKAR